MDDLFRGRAVRVGDVVHSVLPATRSAPAAARPPAGPVCQICGGKGWLVMDVPVGDPDFGTLVPCSCLQAERSKKQADWVASQCRLPDDMRGWTFDNTAELSNQAEALRVARGLVAKPQWFYTLTGGVGVGKTRILCCIVNEAIRSGKSAVYITTAELLESLKRTFGSSAPGSAPGGVGYSELLDLVMDADVLALDEFDRYNRTGWADGIVFQVIETRYRAGASRLTAIASNLAPDEFDPYITSRILDGRCVSFGLGDADLRSIMGR